VGNRLAQTTLAGETIYLYDDANRLTNVGGVTYTWDANGNLLSDGVKTYSYDHATVENGQRPAAYSFGIMAWRPPVANREQRDELHLWILPPARRKSWRTASNLPVRRRSYRCTVVTEHSISWATPAASPVGRWGGERELTQRYAPYGETLSGIGTGVSSYALPGMAARPGWCT
jgi:hypothetical protein